jgi:hypothetical protein
MWQVATVDSRSATTSANGTLQTLMPTLSMSALRGEADIPDLRSNVCFDPKRTLRCQSRSRTQN